MANLAPVRRVLVYVLVLNLLVAGLKMIVGILSGAVSILADGFHSLMDGSSNVVGLIALRFSEVPPDPEHPYGHRKAETLATLVVGGFLLLVALGILEGAVGRLAAGETPEVTPLSFVVMVTTIAINLIVTIYERARGGALSSEFLIADSRHTLSDVWVSASVIGGLVGIRLGLGWLDAAVGLVIAVVIAWSAIMIVRDTVAVLMDAAVLPSDEIERIARSIPEVMGVERIRSRGKADDTHVDLHVRVKPDIPIDYAHSIAHAVQDRISAVFPQVTDITIHTEPAVADHAGHRDASRLLKAIAHSLGASAHEIWMHSVEERFFVELHVEVPPELTLAEAHAIATKLEERGERALPEIAEITTHIEPLGETIEHEAPPTATEEENGDVLAEARRITDSICGEGACHHLYLWPIGKHYGLSMHVVLNPALSIVDAHAVSSRVERTLRRELLMLSRVTVHVEPRGERSPMDESPT